MSAQLPYLEINHVVKEFGQFTALKQISLAIEKGEFVCFLGPSGCGKTTLLRAIAGLDLPTTGTIRQGSKDITFLPPEKRDFGIVFQSYALFPNLTVEENIAIGLRTQGMSRQDVVSKVAYWLEMIGLSTSGPKYPNQLSGGQQQRVALARALALSPGLLLLDEPLSALDAKVRTYLRDEICQLQRKLGITTIMVTHDQEEALSMADRIVVMNHGVIEQVGTPEEIYESPATRFVAQFVGSMNFLPTSIISEDKVTIGETALDTPSIVNQHLSVGEKFDLAVRPENLRFVETAEDALVVRVHSMEFQGAFVRVDCQNQNDLDAALIAVDVPVREARKIALRVGDVRKITFSGDEMRAFECADHEAVMV